ncbi:thiol-disulfide oxidoreductase DCC family protein [Parasphingorhabdus sp.]|uniref:thiol-disulfide oxidoreductase DCC family protein n=1 Tax=Parasphingorhabdus sp. TaxID=2709688 RepID=UPI003BB0B32F
MTKVTVWYDGDCPLCIREIALMRRLDRGKMISFVDLTRFEAPCPVDRQLMMDRFHASENGELYSGAAAFAAMWRAIPLLRPLGLAARRSWVLNLIERAYLLFLRFRPRLQKLAGGRIKR